MYFSFMYHLLISLAQFFPPKTGWPTIGFFDIMEIKSFFI